jgi:hypothetical protein
MEDEMTRWRVTEEVTLAGGVKIPAGTEVRPKTAEHQTDPDWVAIELTSNSREGVVLNYLIEEIPSVDIQVYADGSEAPAHAIVQCNTCRNEEIIRVWGSEAWSEVETAVQDHLRQYHPAALS